MAHPRARRVGSGQRRQVTWVGPADQGFVNVSNGGKTLIASFDPAASSLPKPTLVRTRGAVMVTPQVHTADLEIIGAFGVCVVSDQAFAAGAASIPGPFDESDWDGWVVWRSFNRLLEFVSGVGIIWHHEDIQVDSKAMRKISDNETLVFMAQSQGGAFQISMPLRLLLKLS